MNLKTQERERLRFKKKSRKQEAVSCLCYLASSHLIRWQWGEENKMNDRSDHLSFVLFSLPHFRTLLVWGQMDFTHPPKMNIQTFIKPICIKGTGKNHIRYIQGYYIHIYASRVYFIATCTYCSFLIWCFKTYCKWILLSQSRVALYEPFQCITSVFWGVFLSAPTVLSLHSALLRKAVTTNFLSWVYEDTCWTFADMVSTQPSSQAKNQFHRLVWSLWKCFEIWERVRQHKEDKIQLMGPFLYWHYIFFSCSSSPEKTNDTVSSWKMKWKKQHLLEMKVLPRSTTNQESQHVKV